MTRILVLGDTHCGSISGLTPPGFMNDDLKNIQVPFWDWYSTQVDSYKPFDIVLGTGDFTDGEGKKGTLDTAFSDIRRQAECAEKILEYADVPSDHVYLVRGTPFHSNGVAEYEDKIADDMGCSIADVQRLEVEGWRIHLRHVVGRSDTPYGAATPILKEMTRNLMEAMTHEKDSADIVLRGHSHYAVRVDIDGQIGAIVPCLQLPLSGANGRRYMSWRYTVGFSVLELDREREPIFFTVKMPIKIVHDEGYQCVSQ